MDKLSTDTLTRLNESFKAAGEVEHRRQSLVISMGAMSGVTEQVVERVAAIRLKKAEDRARADARTANCRTPGAHLGCTETELGPGAVYRYFPSKDAIIEAQLGAAQFRQEGFAEGDLLVLTPRKARVFVEG